MSGYPYKFMVNMYIDTKFFNVGNHIVAQR